MTEESIWLQTSDWNKDSLEKYFAVLDKIQKKYGIDRDSALSIAILSVRLYTLSGSSDTSRADEVRLEMREILDRPAKTGGGYTYFLKAKGQNFFKIGVTKSSPFRRIPTVQTGCPFHLYLYAAIYSYNCRKIEKWFHSTLEEYNMHGEWYNVGEDVLNGIIDNEFASEGFDVSEMIGPRYYKEDNQPCG